MAKKKSKKKSGSKQPTTAQNAASKPQVGASAPSPSSAAAASSQSPSAASFDPADGPGGKGILVLFTAFAAFAAYWAFHLIGVHYEVVAGLENGACGPEGGCGAVLQSEWSELFGVPVSAPGVPLYGALAVLGLLTLGGRMERDRLSVIASAAGLVGLAFGGWLLFNMLYYIDSICRFCLIMDGLNLTVLVLGMALHSGRFGGALRGLKSLPGRLTAAGPELAMAAVVLVGTLGVHAMTAGGAEEAARTAQSTTEGAAGTASSSSTSSSTPSSSSPSSSPSSSSSAAPTPSPAPAAGAAPPPGSLDPTATVVTGGAPKPGTRRLVLPAERQVIPLDASVPTLGPADAPVTIVLFEDFQCPFCQKLAGNVDLLREELGDQIRVAFMHFPMYQQCNANELKKNLHKFACGAASAAVCAQEQGKFWEMHDTLFRNNSRLRGRNLSGYAGDLGLDQDAFTACMRNPKTLAKVKKDSAIAGSIGVSGTPTLFINGKRLVGAQPVAALKAAVAIEARGGGDERVLLDVEQQAEIIETLTGASPTVTLKGREGPFTIDAFEASVDSGRAVSKPGVEPARGLTWYEAKSACEAVGKRLCSEEEWLTACSGAIPVDEDRNGVFSTDMAQGRLHSYGEHYREGWCADGRTRADPRPLITGEHPRCSTPEGVYDLEGVTKEWVGLTPDKAALKGGSYFSGSSARCAYFKDSEAPDSRDESIGFRCCSGGDPDEQAQADRFPGGKVGDTVLDWSAPLVDGSGEFGTAQLEGKPFVMTFWASWCEPCKAELPALAEVWKQRNRDGLQVVAINVDENPEKARAYLAANPLPFPVVLDTDQAVKKQFMSRGVPTTFWVQRNGFIRQRTVGYDDSAKGELLESVRVLLAE